MTFLIFKILTFWLFICRDGPDAYYRKSESNNEKMEMASKRMGEVRTCSTSTNFPSWCWWCSCMILHGWCLSETIIICGECGSDGSHQLQMLNVISWSMVNGKEWLMVLSTAELQHAFSCTSGTSRGPYLQLTIVTSIMITHMMMMNVTSRNS